MDLPSRLDLYLVGRDYVVQRAKGINPAQVDTVGSDANIIVASAAHVAYQVILQLGFGIATLLVDTAEGDDLDRLSWDRYQLTRKGAASALGTVRFFRTTVVGGAGTVPQETNLVTLSGVQYITTTDATFGAADLEATAQVRAVQAGASTQVGANTIRKIGPLPTGLPVFDASVQVTNDAPTAGGADAEDDDTYRARIRDFWRTARRGTLSAIEFGAKTVPGVESATATEAILTVTSVSSDAIVAAIKPAILATIAPVSQTSLFAAILQTSLAVLQTALTAVIPASVPGITAANLVPTVQTLLQGLSPVVQQAVREAATAALGQEPNLDPLKSIIDAAVAKAVVTSVEPARVVNLAIADPAGNASTALAASVIAALDDFRAAGIAVLPQLSQPQIVSIALKLTFTATTDTSSLTTQIVAAIVAYVNSLGVGQPLVRDQLGAVLSRYVQDGLIVSNDTIAAPTGDIVPDAGRTIRTTFSNVTVQ